MNEDQAKPEGFILPDHIQQLGRDAITAKVEAAATNLVGNYQDNLTW